MTRLNLTLRLEMLDFVDGLMSFEKLSMSFRDLATWNSIIGMILGYLL